MKGCVRPIESLDDIPPLERGVLENVARELNIPLTRLAMNTALGAAQSYISTDDVTMLPCTCPRGPGRSR